MLKSIPKW